MKLLREPLLHFLLIGAAFFLLYGEFSKPIPGQDDKTITVSAAEIDWLRSNWTQRWSRPPTPVEFEGLVENYIREIVLYREAMALGLDRDDSVIRRRLGMKMEFLVTDMVAMTPPTDEELLAYFDKHRERYQEPALYTFTQVYFDPEKRGMTTLADAEAARAKLVAAGNAIEDPGALGDGLMLANYYADLDHSGIQRLFGNVFAQSLVSLEPGQWWGPVPSGYGTHLVYIHRVTEPPPPDFAALREQLLEDWTREKGEELKQQFVNGLRDQYTVVIEQPASGAGMPASSE